MRSSGAARPNRPADEVGRNRGVLRRQQRLRGSDEQGRRALLVGSNGMLHDASLRRLDPVAGGNRGSHCRPGSFYHPRGGVESIRPDSRRANTRIGTPGGEGTRQNGSVRRQQFGRFSRLAAACDVSISDACSMLVRHGGAGHDPGRFSKERDDPPRLFAACRRPGLRAARRPCAGRGRGPQRHGGRAGGARRPDRRSRCWSAAATRSTPRSPPALRWRSPIRAPAISAAAATWSSASPSVSAARKWARATSPSTIARPRRPPRRARCSSTRRAMPIRRSRATPRWRSACPAPSPGSRWRISATAPAA